MYKLTNEETEKYISWDLRHRKNCPIKDFGAIGGRLTFCFTPTSLGMIVFVKCACGEEKTLSDFENW